MRTAGREARRRAAVGLGCCLRRGLAGVGGRPLAGDRGRSPPLGVLPRRPSVFIGGRPWAAGHTTLISACAPGRADQGRGLGFALEHDVWDPRADPDVSPLAGGGAPHLACIGLFQMAPLAQLRRAVAASLCGAYPHAPSAVFSCTDWKGHRRGDILGHPPMPTGLHVGVGCASTGGGSRATRRTTSAIPMEDELHGGDAARWSGCGAVGGGRRWVGDVLWVGHCDHGQLARGCPAEGGLRERAMDKCGRAAGGLWAGG